jgi:hypothetical protein
MALFVAPKYVEVHQRSPALGSTLGSKQPGILASTGYHLGVRVPRSEVDSRSTNPELASLIPDCLMLAKFDQDLQSHLCRRRSGHQLQ